MFRGKCRNTEWVFGGKKLRGIPNGYSLAINGILAYHPVIVQAHKLRVKGHLIGARLDQLIM